MLGGGKTEREEVAVVPTPEWVVGRKVRNRDSREGEITTHLLFDKQVNEVERTHYFRNVYRVENAAGVERASQLSVNYSPERMKLRLHTIQVFREGELSDRTSQGEFQTIQRELDLEQSLVFHGELTLLKVLYDIRVGDVIDFSYSLEMVNERYRDHFWDLFLTQFSYSRGKHFYSLLTNREESLRFGADHGVAEAERSEENGFVRLSWEFDLQEPVAIDDGMPRGHNPFQTLEFSTMPDYGPIVASESGSWQKDDSFSWPEMESLLRFSEGADEVEKIETAISWVMDHIRYQGIAIGELAVVPAPVTEVLERRFGDCKEKSALLVKILRALGHQAWPALVSSEQRWRIAERLPSPSVFDHAIVCLEFNGALHWIDATNPYVSRKIGRFRKSDFGYALLLDQKSASLVEMEKWQPEDFRITTETVARIREGDFGGRLDYSLEATGLAAEKLKYLIELEGKALLEESLLNQLRERFADIEFEAGVEVTECSWEKVCLFLSSKVASPHLL